MPNYSLVNETRFKPIPVRAARPKNQVVCAGGILVKKDKFLFGKRARNKDWAPGLWDIVGGRSLKNEHPMFTLQREVYEETGAMVLNAELISEAEVINDNDRNPLFTYHLYVITHFKKKVFNKSDEHTKLKWFSRSELNALPLALAEYLTLIDEWIERNQTQAAPSK